jgi:dihydrofolate reductase
MAHEDTEQTGSVIWHVTMSLDGFIAGPGDSMDWVFDYTGPNEAVEEVLRTTGALLIGRRSYYVGRREEQLAAVSETGGEAWDGPRFVITHEPPAAPEDPSVTFLSDELPRAVEIALAAADGRNVVVIGATVARAAIDEGLIDEIVVHLAPVLLGEGVRLFEGRPSTPVKLERTALAESGDITDLWFRVLKENAP